MDYWQSFKLTINNICIKTYPMLTNTLTVFKVILCSVYFEIQMHINFFLLLLILGYFYYPSLMDDVIVSLLQTKKYMVTLHPGDAKIIAEPLAVITPDQKNPSEPLPTPVLICGLAAAFIIGILFNHTIAWPPTNV